MVAKSDPRLAFRAVLDSTIALAVWLQIELAEPWQPWLADIRSRLGNIMRADALGEPLACQAIVGLSDEDLHRLSHQPLRYLDHDHLVPEASHGRDAALLNLLRTKVRETETVAAQVFITRSFEVLRAGHFAGAEPPFEHGLRDDDPERSETTANGEADPTTTGGNAMIIKRCRELALRARQSSFPGCVRSTCAESCAIFTSTRSGNAHSGRQSV